MKRGILALALAGVLSAVLALVFVQPAYAANAFQIKNSGSGLCIQTPPGDSGPDVQLVQQRCDPNNAAQRWIPVSLGGSDFHFVNQGNGDCMRAHGGNADFVPVETIDCTPISDSRWTFA